MVFTRLRNRVEIDTFFRFNHLKGVIHYDDACKLLCYRRERNDLWTFNTNLIKIIGNSFMQPVIDATLGVMFGGSWLAGDSMFGDQGTISGYYTGEQTVLNKIMGTLGGLATIYTLGTNDAKTKHNDTVVSFTL